MLKEYDHIFYISPKGVDIEDNGVRETNEDYRKLIDETIQLLLIKYRHKLKNITFISGSVEERVESIKQAVSL
tara:strand:- start:942 stop:1160 length:219 start_codon:yes stop_codon:yes gene_type:complete